MTDLPTSLLRRAPPNRRPWLDRLAGDIQACVREWGLECDPPYPGLWLNYAAPVTLSDGTPSVLKIGDPTDKEFASELAALRLYGGHGAVRLLRADPERGAMLLERLGPPLAEAADDDAATLAAAEVVRHIHRPAPPAPHPFPTVADWGRGFARLRTRYGGGTGPFPPLLVDAAERLYAELLGSSGPSLLLHGDLHAGNILSASRAPWLAIDPKGVLGEATFETTSVIRDRPPHGADPRRVYARRLAILSEALGLDRDRMLSWSLAQSVLSAWWSVEDGGDPWPALRCAETLQQLDSHN